VGWAASRGWDAHRHERSVYRGQKQTPDWARIGDTPSPCQPEHTVPGCDRPPPPSLLARSYRLREHWPIGPIDLVMETQPGTCDMYRQRFRCCELSRDDSYAIEYWVREAVISALAGCHRRACRAIDLGANNGWMTAYMLALGAAVLSVEPQPDFAAAIAETARLNCWTNRSTVVNAFACANADDLGADLAADAECFKAKVPHGMFRPGGSPAFGVRVPGIALDDILESGGGVSGTVASGERVHLDLVKMDGDGPEVGWLARIERLLSIRGNLTIDVMIFEQLRQVPAWILRRFQTTHGYDLYRLDTDDFRRLVTPTGWDAYSPPNRIAPIGHVRGALTRDSLEEEMFGVRAMRHLWRAKRGLSEGQLNQWLAPVPNAHIRYHVMEIMLVHRRRVSLFERRSTGWKGFRESPEARSVNYTGVDLR
jgi:FkbM family methyltransferase